MQSVFHHKGKTQDLQSTDWLKVIEAEQFSAVVFDCDGTLVESADAHLHCMQTAAMEQGVEMPTAWYLERTGLDRRSLFEDFADDAGQRFDAELARVRSIALFGKFVDLVRPLAEPVELAKTLWHSAVSLAVVTNAEREVAHQSLGRVGILRLFDHVVSISDGGRPKPAPDMFVLAAEKLAVAPDEILVFEDSPQGVSAALAAGTSVVQLEHASDVGAAAQTKSGA